MMGGKLKELHVPSGALGFLGGKCELRGNARCGDKHIYLPFFSAMVVCDLMLHAEYLTLLGLPWEL